jgi:hypothetical protein
MSGPIKNKILSALKALDLIETKFDAQYDASKSVLENMTLLEVSLSSIREEIERIENQKETVNASLSLWADLLRKMAPDDRDAADIEYDTFYKDNDVSKKVDLAETKLKSWTVRQQLVLKLLEPNLIHRNMIRIRLTLSRWPT